MIWEISASGRADNIHDTLLAAATSKDEELAKAGTPLGAEEQEQISVAIGFAVQVASRHGNDDGSLWNVLLRGRTDPGNRGYHVAIGEVAPPEPEPAAA